MGACRWSQYSTANVADLLSRAVRDRSLEMECTDAEPKWNRILTDSEE